MLGYSPTPPPPRALSDPPLPQSIVRGRTWEPMMEGGLGKKGGGLESPPLRPNSPPPPPAPVMAHIWGCRAALRRVLQTHRISASWGIVLRRLCRGIGEPPSPNPLGDPFLDPWGTRTLPLCGGLGGIPLFVPIPDAWQYGGVPCAVRKVGCSPPPGVQKIERTSLNGCCSGRGYRGQNLGPWDPWQASDV